jgi:hypothetical protein
MEHEYTKPTHEIVLGSIDLCDLIFLASERFLRGTPGRLRIKFKNDDRDLIALLKPGGTKIQFFEILGAESDDGPNGKYYSGRLFDFDNKPLQNIRISRIEDSDIELTLSNKHKWFLLVKTYASIARDPEQFLKLPEEPMATISHMVPWKIAKAAFMKITSDLETENSEERSKPM